MLLVLGMQEYECKKFLLVLRFAKSHFIHGFNEWIANFAVFVDCSGYMFDNVKGCNDVE